MDSLDSVVELVGQRVHALWTLSLICKAAALG